MNMQQENGLRRAYECFSRRHAALRNELLTKIRDGSFDARGPIRLTRRWPWAAALAASLLISLVCSAVFWFRTPVAYAVADIPKRLAGCDSVLVDGWEDIRGVRYPIHLYVQRGRYLWETSVAGVNDRVFSGYYVSDSEHYLDVSDQDHTATYGQQNPLAFELAVQGVLQLGLPEKLVGPNGSNFIKTGESSLDGCRINIYEQRSGGHQRVIWLNPATGVPARVQLFEPGEDSREKQTAQWTIATNVSPPPDLPSFTLPTGYAVIRHDRERNEAFNIESVGGNGDTFQVLCDLNLEGQAILLCWQRFDTNRRAVPTTQGDASIESSSMLDFRLANGRRKYFAISLRDDPWTDGHIAHWTLLVPENGSRVDRAMISFKQARGSMSMNLLPLRFDRTRLAQLVLEVQQVTMPAGHTALNLQELENMAQRFTER